MSLLTTTLTINPAFLQEIKEDHHELWQLMDACRGLCKRGRTGHVPAHALAEALSSLRDRLSLHFALEEAYGYFEDAVAAAPQLTLRATQLRQEHGPLFTHLAQLVERAERVAYHQAPHEAVRAISLDFARFDRDLARHEATEDALILTAFTEELGAGG